MNVASRWGFVLAVIAALILSSKRGETAEPSTNPLYLIISNAQDTVSLTAYHTLTGAIYHIQTNSDLSNPAGWGLWLDVTAAGDVTSLGSLLKGGSSLFFRALVDSGVATNSVPPDMLYLGEVSTPTNQVTPTVTTNLSVNTSSANAVMLPGWAVVANPAGDCRFYLSKDSLLINVPGSEMAHDLAADIGKTNAPTVTLPVAGDFTIQVRTEGRYEPGGKSTQPGRFPYNGAALIAMVDGNNVITLARAVLQRSGSQPACYANFEERVDAQLQRIGYTSDGALPQTGPVYLRLKREGTNFIGSVSTNGQDWNVLGTKSIPTNWSSRLSVGLTAISTSEAEFNPRFSEIQLTTQP